MTGKTPAVGPDSSSHDEELKRQIKSLGPWHLDIQVTESVSTGRVFSKTGSIPRASRMEIALISPRDRFLADMQRIFPEGLEGKRFLDCACNAGGYCFWARELGAETIGFDAREHWIQQATFVQAHRTAGPTDRMQFLVCDLYDVPKQQWPPFDITLFKGIFYHLPDPVHGLKIAADLTRDILWFNSSTTWGEPDGSLNLVKESTDHLMSGVHGLAWFPTGPQVVADMLAWLGFVDVRLKSHVQDPRQPHRGRLDMVAARRAGMLDRLPGKQLVKPQGRSRPSKAA